MTLHRIGAVVLGTVIFSPALLSVPLHAQSDPMTMIASQTQPNLPQQQQPASTSMQDSGQNANEVAQTMKDKMFLREAAEGGLAEIKFGQLAAGKASSDDVKAFGQKMVDDHTKLNDSMAGLADTMGIRLPKSMNKEDQAEYDKLNVLSGNDFDTEYLSLMVKDHHKDLHAFRMEVISVTDPVLRDAVTNAGKIIHEHSVMVDKLAREKGIPVPVRGNRPAPSPTS